MYTTSDEYQHSLAVGRTFGLRIVNSAITAIVDQPELADLHWYRWAKTEREFREWLFAKYHLELVP